MGRFPMATVDVKALVDGLKPKLSAKEQKLLDKLMEDAETLAKAADSDGDGQPDPAGIKALFIKNGEFSKTSTILVISWLVGLGMWLVQGLFHGLKLPLLNVIIPPFDASAALSMLGAASTLYMATHNIKVNLGGTQPSESDKSNA